MKKAVLCVLLISMLQSEANAVNMGMVTGGSDGTYYEIGKNISSLVSKHGINLTVHTSAGSLSNVVDVYRRRGVQIGIAQSDVLSYVDKYKDDKMKRIAEKIKMIYPLYNEEVHLLGNHNTGGFSDLYNKVVAVGKENSGTYLTSSLLFYLSGIKPGKRVEIGGKEALDALRKGEIDAMFYVVGYPAELFHEINERRFHLIPIQEKSITEFYIASSIPASAYSWQNISVPTVTARAILITYDYKGNNCANVRNFAKVIYENLDWLKKYGHPKWKNVDFDSPIRNWDQYGCVKMQRPLNNTTSDQSLNELKKHIMDAVKDMNK